MAYGETDTYYSNLLKIWDLDAADNKVLLTHFPRTQGAQARTHRSGAHEKCSALSDSAGIEGCSGLYDIDRGLLTEDVLPADGRSVQWHSPSSKMHLLEDICSNCSHRNSSDSNWCIECGKALIVPKYTEIPHQAEQDSAISHIAQISPANSLTDDNLSELIECFGNLRHSPNCSLGGHGNLRHCPNCSLEGHGNLRHCPNCSLGGHGILRHSPNSSLGGHTDSCCTVAKLNKEVNHSTPSSSFNPAEETQIEPIVHVQSYKRHWKTSSAYMWRKPSTLDALMNPSVTPPASAWMLQYSPIDTDNVRRKHILHLDLNCSDSVEESPVARSMRIMQSAVRPGPCDLLSLPNEMLLMVLSLLRDHELLRCMLVCKRLYCIATEPTLWKSISLHKITQLTKTLLMTVARRQPQHLTLSHCQGNFTPKDLQTFFKQLPLKHITLDTCNLGLQTGDMLVTTAALHCPQLTSIDVRWTQLSDRALIYASEHCPRIEEVCLEQTPATTMSALRQVIQHHGRWLKVLKLKGKLGFAAADAVKQCGKHLPVLTAFAATYPQVEVDSIQKLGCAFPNLTTLELHCTIISEAAIGQLSQMLLESLSIISLTPLSTHCLAHISKMSSLRHFTTESVDDEGVKALCSGSLQLQSLTLRNSDITENSLHIISECFNKTLLRFEGSVRELNKAIDAKKNEQ